MNDKIPGFRQKPLWELRGICKSFPDVRANDDVSLTLHAGEIHGLIGENGCGKSTLIKILSGVYQPDEGTMMHNGVALTLKDPTQARTAGVATVFQEFSLVPQLSVAENVFLGRHPKNWGKIKVNWGSIYKNTRKIFWDLDIDIDPYTPLGKLSVAQQQLVEIAKALSQEATLLILDEPTTALGQEEIKVLHHLLQRMAKRGVAMLYISHRLDEVVEFVDAVTVLKDGAVVSSPGETPLKIDDLVTAMIGGEVKEHYPKASHVTDANLLEVSSLVTDNKVKNVTFALHKGEVLGLGGVIGSGRTEIARALFGVDRLKRGEIRLEGATIKLSTPRDAIKNGLALVPENRKFDGLFFNYHAGPNITMANIDAVTKGWRLDNSSEENIAQEFIDDLEISPLALRKFINLISGGNQQKVLIARWLFTNAKVFILDEPTQGIDIGAKLAVYKLINDMTKAGKGVVLISSDHNELIAMSDRIAIVRHGEIIGIKPSTEVTPADLLSATEISSHITATKVEG